LYLVWVAGVVDSLGEDDEKVDLFMSNKTCGEVDTLWSASGKESDGSPNVAKPKKWRLVSWPQMVGAMATDDRGAVSSGGDCHWVVF
jgi:hypothetical protein